MLNRHTHRTFWIAGLGTALLSLLMASASSQAADERSVTEDGYKIVYSVFPSEFIKPDIAEQYGLIRGADRALLNVVVTVDGKETESLGIPASIEGEASNLLQQSQTLEFKTINEGNTVYYIAPVRHLDEEIYNFYLKVTPEGHDKAIRVQFNKKLYKSQ
ncbi:DUF4426 domain-containing protein [Sessilibacter sp. MAH2]